MNGQEEFEYQMLVERMNAMSFEFDRVIREISQAKTRVENEHDRLLTHLHKVFGDHPNFDMITQYGYYDGWTGAGIERN
jgi:hypothetical protein